jgi:hypothetical protein
MSNLDDDPWHEQMAAAIRQLPPRRPYTAPGVAAQVAEAFHTAYERLAPTFDYATRPESAVAWEDVPAANQTLMVATVQALLDEGVIAPGWCTR